MSKQSKTLLYLYAQIILGVILCAAGYSMFLIPNDLAPGGFTGIAQLINRFSGWPVGIVSLALNVPLFAFSARTLGLSFGLRSLFATVTLSLAIDYLPIPPILPADAAQGQLLATVFGGVMCGIGFGLVIRGNATTGGTDMLAKLINDHITGSLSVGVIMFLVDGVVILTAAFVFDVVSALFALIATFIMSYMIDFVLDGLNPARAYFVISNQSKVISERLMSELDRGVTAFSAWGAYTGDQKEVLLCVVGRAETVPLKRIVASVDPNAFVIATNVHEALGEGFKPHKVKNEGR